KPGRRYVTIAQSQSDAAKLKSAQIALAKAKVDLRTHQKYDGPKQQKTLQGTIDETKRVLDRVKIQAEAKRVTAEAAKKAAKSVWHQEKKKADDLKGEIKKCRIVAPQDGLVVYHVDERSRWGAGQQSLIAQGEPVREGQKLMRIPNLNKMVVATKVHEAMVS